MTFVDALKMEESIRFQNILPMIKEKWRVLRNKLRKMEHNPLNIDKIGGAWYIFNMKPQIYSRTLSFDLPMSQSAFIWGPRKCGKTTYLLQKYPQSIRYDFLKTDIRFEMLKNPARLRQELTAMEDDNQFQSPVILDEVQYVPQLLDEVQWLIDNKKTSFVLCGSSARKLKRGHANMLGGRAWRFELYPLCYKEVPSIDLLKALNNGLLPAHYNMDDAKRSLKAYVGDYLKEEILEEGLTRNIQAFSRFTDVLGFCSGEMVNYNNIARETGVDGKTVKGYFQIVLDTLLGTFLPPYSKKNKRSVVTTTPKFYLFDVGVAGYLARRTVNTLAGSEFGRAFEHYIYMELLAYRSYHELDMDFSYWRTSSGLEVDFIVGNAEIAIEIKGTNNISNKETRGLRAFIDEYRPLKALIVCNETRLRQVGDITVYPWRDFLDALWSEKILK
jgi:predicted AAA+ superfamily ATPase